VSELDDKEKTVIRELVVSLSNVYPNLVAKENDGQEENQASEK